MINLGIKETRSFEINFWKEIKKIKKILDI